MRSRAVRRYEKLTNPMSKPKRSLDVIGELEDELAVNPLDLTKWTRLIKQVLVKDKEEQVRLVFDKYLAIFKFDVCMKVLAK